MFLERVEISGFRGINRLSLVLDDNTILIGENAWGKSSLLDALTVLLSPKPELYHFNERDFYHSWDEHSARKRDLQIILTFCEKQIGHHRATHLRNLRPLWVDSEQALKCIYLRVSGELQEDGTVYTHRCFLNKQGDSLRLHDDELLLREIIRLYPVLRLRDARFINEPLKEAIETDDSYDRKDLREKMEQLASALMNNPQKLTNGELWQGLEAMKQLIGYYFAEQRTYLFDQKNIRHRSNSNKDRHDPRQRGWQVLDSIHRISSKPNQRNVRLIILSIFSSLLQSNGAIFLDSHAHPLIIVENPETRLHPIMLSISWGLMNLFSLQRITTTNSGELLSQAPLRGVCRLVRHPNRVVAHRLGENYLSAEEVRRVSFHIHFNRPSALFARCWLLVEGETEVWLINDLARQCGYYFKPEGIKVIEFSQSGLKPLLKFANRMGIEWHTLVDGDDAGKKYAATAKLFAEHTYDTNNNRLTSLPALDMEHFLYRVGFSDVYHEVANTPKDTKLSTRKVITKAIQRSSKPDLAISVASYAAERGVAAIPLLLKEMFSRVVWLARRKVN
ncbi:ATP-dependent nuclease [Xenorhabdus hominickii]|uniref:ATP-dependent endonuclease n=1 Tax=Xenorhabdus hominickii TaxID=351679 RepID=A0A2G0QAT5_XENHO|nr:ATP-dependent endonuclease [Xenorhabdus hominickii]AOM40706.1 ATP-dependent endonuclease [Xenorhabdus hominickii]PHM56344.1 ATP-dependent endonuclease [Xenorhabdus hominickii]